jgi:fructose-1,6-bisphosphatase I|tara:strand:+ start:1480 stop:3882 length:2403 start_codon:yes stop_codon:yes gene_type:complete
MAAADMDSTLGAAQQDLLTTPAGRLPPAILSNVPGTWAHDTVSRRLRESILSRIVADNAETLAADPAAAAAFAALDLELADAANVSLRAIEPDGGCDVPYWNDVILPPWIGKTWLDTPWLVSEFYFYRRVLAACGYFGQGPGSGKDPFQKDKDAGLAACVDATKSLAPKLNAFADESGDESATRAAMRLFVLVSLWGNRMDLSIWPAADGVSASGASGASAASSSSRAAQAFDEALRAGEECLLWDDSVDAAHALVATGCDKVGIVVDNAGFELVCDLALADAIVVARVKTSSKSTTGVVVTLHVKAHPTFVSDAMSKDVHATIYETCASTDKETSLMGKRWRKHVETGAWVIAPRFEWAQPQAFWDLPLEAVQALQNENLVILKGDANYRRLLGDRVWSLQTPFSEVAGYFPAPLLALRTLKAELGCGIPAEQEERAASENPGTWMTDGKFGVVQYLASPARQTAVANAAWRWDGPGSDATSRKDLALVLVAIANACAELRTRLSTAPLHAADSFGYVDGATTNATGDKQKKLDVVANKLVRDALTECGAVRFYCSEEETSVIELTGGGKFVVVCDPLDGSRNVDVGVPVGTIFGVYLVKAGITNEQQALRPGNELVAAGYCNYSSSTAFVVAIQGEGAPVELDLTRGSSNSHGDFMEARTLACPMRGQTYSLNDARFQDWPEGLRAYITDVRSGNGATKKQYSARYVCSLVTDFHRTLYIGGWCGNPRPHLRLVYECAPLAFVANAAGGRGSDGVADILCMTPKATHERTPFFVGSVEDIDELESYGDVQQAAAEYNV